MKNGFMIALALVGTSAYANTVATVFRRDSKLPEELKSRVLAAVEAQCAHVLTQFGLSESSTTVASERVDQGVIDYFYTTKLKSQGMDSDGYHPIWNRITVSSAQWAISNPPEASWEVLQVDCDK